MIPEDEFNDNGRPLRPRHPWWFTTILILLTLPAFSTPWLIADVPEASLLQGLIKCFPAFMILAAFCAWFTYPQHRDIAWILVAVMILCSLSLFMI